MTPVVPEHLGGLHPLESALVALLAFGPFVALAVVVVLQRRRDAAEDVEVVERVGEVEPVERQSPD